MLQNHHVVLQEQQKCYSLQMLQIFMLFYKGEIFYKRKKDATYLIEKRMMVKTSLEFFSQIAKNVTWLPNTYMLEKDVYKSDMVTFKRKRCLTKKILLWAYSFLERTWKLLMDILHYYEEQGYYYILVNLHTVQWKPT